MDTVVTYLVASAALCWFQVTSASLIKAKGWTPAGMIIAFGNRDNVPEGTAFAERSVRAGNNLLESMPLLAVLTLAAWISSADPAKVTMGIQVFFWARVVYAIVYMAGVPYLRTLVWGVSLAGLGMIGLAALG